MQDKKKVTIINLVPYPESAGGISEYYRLLNKYKTNKFNHKYLYRGKRKGLNNIKLLYFFSSILDTLNFILNIITKKNSIIVVNTSLNGFVSLYRDSIYIAIALLFKKQNLLFIHGWDDDFVEKNKSNFFFKIFMKSKNIIVIRDEVKCFLEYQNYNGKIFKLSTMIDDILVDGINKKDVLIKHNDNIINLLFLSRLVEAKGIFELLGAYKKLWLESDHKYSLTIAGNGIDLIRAQDYVKKNKLKDVYFLGHISGERKKLAYMQAHIYVFPSYTEGMPTSVLEALSFGLPILTTPVGAIPEFFHESHNGYYIELKSIDSIYKKISALSNSSHRIIISENNFKTFNNRFRASNSVSTLEEIYYQIEN